MSVRAVVSVITMAATIVAPALFAAEPIQLRPVSCISAAQNPRVVVSLPPNMKSARVFFKAAGQESEYYVDMHRGDNGWWAFLPMPDQKTSALVYRAVPVDDKGMQSSSPFITTPVSAACPLQSLTADEQRVAQNLVLGLTTASQSTLPAGFQCRGVVSYIAVNGDLKPNDQCRRVLAAANAAGGTATPLSGTAGAGAGGLSPKTLGALAAFAAAGAGWAIYQHDNKSKRSISPARPSP